MLSHANDSHYKDAGDLGVTATRIRGELTDLWVSWLNFCAQMVLRLLLRVLLIHVILGKFAPLHIILIFISKVHRAELSSQSSETRHDMQRETYVYICL